MSKVVDLEKEFSPSVWSKRFNETQILEHHKKVVRDGTKLARELLKCELDVPYGSGERSKMDIYGTDLPSDAPIFVLIHGGYWQIEEYTKVEGTYGTLPLVRAGCRVIAVDYEMCPNVTLSELVELSHKFISFILNYAAKLGAPSVSFLGHSAGAHLLATQFQEAHFSQLPHRALIKDIYLLSGLYDLRELRHTNAANKGNLLSITDANVAALSPGLDTFEHLTNIPINFILALGEDESLTFRKTSEDMRDALLKGTHRVKYHLLPNRDHFDLVEQLNEQDAELTKILLENLVK